MKAMLTLLAFGLVLNSCSGEGSFQAAGNQKRKNKEEKNAIAVDTSKPLPSGDALPGTGQDPASPTLEGTLPNIGTGDETPPSTTPSDESGPLDANDPTEFNPGVESPDPLIQGDPNGTILFSSDASPSDDASSPAQGSGEALPPTALLPSGRMKDECKEKKTFPLARADLQLAWEWKAEGANAQYRHVIVTPIVSKLRATDKHPTVFAVGYGKPIPGGDPNGCQGEMDVDGRLFAIDGESGRQLWSSDLNIAAWLPPVVGDVNGDGTSEIVVLGRDRRVHMINFLGHESWVSANETLQGSPDQRWPTGLGMADVTGSGRAEVLAGTLVLDAASGAKLYEVEGNGFIMAANTDLKGGLEVVTDTGVYRGSDGVKICDYRSANALYISSLGDFAIAQLRETDQSMTIVGTNKTALIEIDAATCKLVKSVLKPVEGGGAITLADFNGDKQLDIVIAGKHSLVALDTRLNPLWTRATQDESSEVTGVSAMDFNGDGINEVVYADERYIQVFRGNDGMPLFRGLHSSGTVRETPAIADIRGDGRTYVAVGANACHIADPNQKTFTGVRVFKERHNGWVGTRPVWNAQAYMPDQVTDDGKIVASSQADMPWLGAAYLTGFRANVARPAAKASCAD